MQTKTKLTASVNKVNKNLSSRPLQTSKLLKLNKLQEQSKMSSIHEIARLDERQSKNQAAELTSEDAFIKPQQSIR